MRKHLYAGPQKERKSAGRTAPVHHAAAPDRATTRRTDTHFAGMPFFGNRNSSVVSAGSSVAPGTEQGGLIDWFRGLFGRKDAAKEAAGEQHAAENDRQDPVPEAGQSAGGELQAKVEQLRGLHWLGGKENSGLHNTVLSCVNEVLSGLQGAFGGDLVQNLRMMERQEQAYQKLAAACAAYTARKPITPVGKARKAVVEGIQELVQRDLLGIIDARTDICGMPAEEQSGLSWREVLGKARTVRLTVSDYGALGRAEGGQVSDVRMLHSGNATLHGGGTLDGLKFFKAEDSLDVDGAKDESYLPSLSVGMTEALKKFPDLSAQDRDVLREYLVERRKGRRAPADVVEKLSAEGKTALGYLQKFASGNNTFIDEMLSPSGILGVGGVVNMTRRNVATSRMAELLGVGHLMARSQTAEVYDEKTGNTIRGNLMDQARGVKYEAAKQKRGKSAAAGGNPGFSGAFQRDVTSIQVLDILCGQMDRHDRNFFYEMDEEGNLIGLQGIDNDASFGTNIDVVHAEQDPRADRRVYDIGGEQVQMTLPFMDAQLASRIEELSPEAVRYALADLLKEEEIEAAVRRLGLMKIAIQNARSEQKQDGKKRFLEREEEWGKEVAEEMFRRSQMLAGEKKEMSKSSPEQERRKAEILYHKMKEAGLLLPEDKTPQDLLTRIENKGRDRTEMEEALLSKASIEMRLVVDRMINQQTSANDTYLGRLLRAMGYQSKT